MAIACKVTTIILYTIFMQWVLHSQTQVVRQPLGSQVRETYEKLPSKVDIFVAEAESRYIGLCQLIDGTSARRIRLAHKQKN